jgi:hypothetical protein
MFEYHAILTSVHDGDTLHADIARGRAKPYFGGAKEP